MAHLTRLVDDLLDLSRIARGTVTIRKEPVELGEFVRHAAEDEQSTCAAKGVHLRLDVKHEPLWCCGNAARLAQVVSNLLSNGCKFTDKGGHVDVSLSRENSTGVLCVRDDGIGIARDMLDKVFDTFTHPDTSLARRRGGLGLGLALVKTLVELHDGTVEVHSAGLGQGIRFAVRLPLSAAPEAFARRQITEKQSHRRVLLIENHLDAAESLHAALALHGHDVRVAHSGREGIAVAPAFQPDVIICNVGLPDLDGYEVARALRADKSLRGGFLIALTGYALQDDVQRAYEAGFDRHLAKPASEELLEQTLVESPGHTHG